MPYVDIPKHWRKIRDVATSQECREIWLYDLMEYRACRQIECLDGPMNCLGWDHKDYEDAEYPSEFDSCDWRMYSTWGSDRYRRGPESTWWKYAVHGACYWTVNMNLYIARTVFWKEDWRIVVSSEHATVWNGDGRNRGIGDGLLFDIARLAVGVKFNVTWNQTVGEKTAERLSVGEYYEVNTWSDIVKEYTEGKVSKKELLITWKKAAKKEKEKSVASR